MKQEGAPGFPIAGSLVLTGQNVAAPLWDCPTYFGSLAFHLCESESEFSIREVAWLLKSGLFPSAKVFARKNGLNDKTKEAAFYSGQTKADSVFDAGYLLKV